MGDFFQKTLIYLNENPWVDIVLALFIAAVGWFIQKKVKSSRVNSNKVNVKNIKDSKIKIDQKN